MSKIIGERAWLGSTDIGSIKLGTKSRDDIPAPQFRRTLVMGG